MVNFCIVGANKVLLSVVKENCYFLLHITCVTATKFTVACRFDKESIAERFRTGSCSVSCSYKLNLSCRKTG